MENTQYTPFAKAGVITAVSLFLGILFNYFFFEKAPGISFPIYIALIIGGLFTIAGIFKKRLSKQVLWLLIPLMFFSIMVFVRASFLLTFLNIVSSLLLLLIIAKVAFDLKIRDFLATDYAKIFFLPFKFIRPLFTSLSDLILLRGVTKDGKVFSQVIKGLIITLPVLVIFLLLFSSADLIFEKYLSDLIHIEIDDETIARLIFILCFTLAYIGSYSYIFRKTEDTDQVKEKTNSYTIGSIENSILLGSVNALFFIFILVQLTYLFGGESNISVQGFTFAEYARKGFFELIWVAIISLILLLAAEKYTVKNDAKHKLGFKILSTALIVQVIIIMTSAFTRLSLYEAAYGFTTLRLYSHAFIIFLGVIFVLLILKIYKDKTGNLFAFRTFVSIILFLAVMNFLNPDSFIANKNIERFEATGKLDVYYLNSLSDDAIPEVVKALEISDENLKNSLSKELYLRNTDRPAFQADWQSLNIARMNANKILDSK